MTLDAVQKRYATAAVPRYTRYPSVPHFGDDFPEAAYRDWLGRLQPDEPLSLYLHVPFCRSLCWYCGCNMRLVSRYEPVSDYVTTLECEIDLLCGALPARMQVSHLHWGGGTPTALTPDDLERLMDRLRGRFDFAPGAELAIESDPRTLTREMTTRIGRLGFTRASFGVQEFDDRVQRAINRVQSETMVRGAIDDLRSAGVPAVNVDLIYGLPHQSVESLTRTVAACVRMWPDRLALFGYAHVPWMAKKQRLIDESALPGPEARAAQASAAADTLTAAGYRAIGLDHFARPDDSLSIAADDGTLRRNFQGYTTDQARALLGLGVTSIGRTPDGFVQNRPGGGAWGRDVETGRLPVAKGHALSADDRLRAEVIESLMCRESCDLAATARQHGIDTDWWQDARGELEPMVEDGLLDMDGDRISITERGRPLVRVIAAAFDAYRRRAPARHSVAV